MSDRVIIHDRIGVRGQHVPVDNGSFLDIPEEYYNDLEDIRNLVEELENSRYELGRLMQVVNHLVYTCNLCERKLAGSKEGIIKGMGLEDGNWAIDFESKQIGRVSHVDKPTPRVP